MKVGLSLLLLLFATSARADSGGPYLGVPDIKKDESPPVFAIPQSSKPLRYYLTNFPQLRRNKKVNEPDYFDWSAIKLYHASVSSLGYVGGCEILCVRYISDKRVEQGLAYADALVLLARNSDTLPNSNECHAIFYASGGAVYNYDAERFRGEKYGAVVVRGYYSGNEGSVDETYIRAVAPSEFRRFTPKK